MDKKMPIALCNTSRGWGEILELALQQAGYEVCSCQGSPQQLLRQLLVSQAQIVALDLGRTPREYLHTLRCLWERHPQRPQLIMTSSIEAFTRGRRPHYVSACLFKPFTPSQFLERVAHCRATLGSPGASLGDRWRQFWRQRRWHRLWKRVEEKRQATQRQLYSFLRSGGRRPLVAWEVWRRWEYLEYIYLLAERQVALDLAALEAYYELLGEQIERGLPPASLHIGGDQGLLGAVSLKQFLVFYERLQKDQVAYSNFQLAAAVRLLHPTTKEAARSELLFLSGAKGEERWRVERRRRHPNLERLRAQQKVLKKVPSPAPPLYALLWEI